MADAIEVKNYLGHWFQLGRAVIFPKSNEVVLPSPIFAGQRFSRAFEDCWQRILTSREDCYLEGTEQTLQSLLSGDWEIISCARCALPVPLSHSQIPNSLCPCVEVESWPNLELPLPRLPANQVCTLRKVQERLIRQEEGD
ncbi:slr0217 [Synechocystis sp. PCC 6803]|uniref:Slr0217 protein n=1 Tax=Synechocystis sp. (strain ATCC 27184 / PCC 6803 / Kazusa) TaxID=1111708 RepID=Q55686_SYNY3|nr:MULTISPECIES: hypothetical protein [unclassified Synechocystis]BAM54441.1 hypothetical protein BEST7613_5510 [Synechocystis sp. PCC 6803] [Bacillus subtilis BEST7613]AGF52507.1 hypothetical protein MYO_122750 [Synechocystis sp. PCC 6803]ALJ68434.1 hypothetical protein AOY38_11690 [Synechocystis sp. PCC 6803]AVP90277.1 hypothetical protein C7I86_11760 [Synechocystis sp. IPPAS B-1465]MBD2619733.1 hypothetical protein [Synechocystis sp. FACHB-898]